MRVRITGRWVIGYQNGSHCIVPRGDVVYEGDTVVYVGTNYSGDVDQSVDATDHLVVPGFIDLDCPTGADPRRFRIDRGSQRVTKGGEFWNDTNHALAQSRLRSVARYSVARALRMGSTTIRATTGTATKRWDDPAYEPGTVAEAMEHLGVRGYVAHWFRSVPSELEVQGGDRTEYRDESRGRRGLDRAVEFVDSIADAERVHGYICPDSIETCSTELLRAAKREANRLGVRVVTKYGGDEHGGFPPRDDEDRSSLQHLDEEGVLDRPLLVMLDPPRAGQGKRSLSSGELEVLTRRDVTLGRVPQVAAREGAFADSISRFEAQGTAVGLGTGGDPPDPVAAMRCESAAGKAVERRADTSSSRAVFDAMTLGGARAVGRTDIGRLAPGSKADIVCVDFDRPHVGYVHDPIRALVNHCYGSDVDRVVVGGRTLVADGTVRALDASRMADEMEEATDAVASVLSDRESTDLEGDELFEQSYPNRSGGS